ncbi:MAG: hypothetical protein ABSF18_07665 [Gammaproteobacteria bacterium]|jgi:hypothetical protein
MAVADLNPNLADYYFTPWQDFLDSDFDWVQGEHITMIGTTGQGKTTLELQFVAQRKYWLFLSTKSIDETQEELIPLGFRWANRMSDVSLDLSDKWVINPGGLKKKETVSDMKLRQRPIYREAIATAYHHGGWVLVIDEGRYICDYLGLKDEVTLAYLQGRSHKLSVVMGTQRPRYVPLESFDAATHLFFWRDNDLGNIDRVSELAGLRRMEVRDIVPRLEQYEMLYINTRTGLMVITKVDL